MTIGTGHTMTATDGRQYISSRDMLEESYLTHKLTKFMQEVAH